MTTSTPSSPIVFYDIAMRPPVTETYSAPNPSKTRFALNFKKIPYKTSWVPLPDVSKVRRSLDIPACRQFADGTEFNTLPIIHDPATNSIIGDSFDIAVYLQRTYPDSGAGDLLPPQKLDYVLPQEFAILVPLTERSGGEFPEYARFNNNVDAAFTAHAQLMVGGMPLDPATADQTKAEFVRRAGVSSWDDFALTSEAREKLMVSFRDTLGGLAKLFLRDTSGPFLLGKQASYADIIVGGWLRMARVNLPQGEWEEVRSWHSGVFGGLYDALEVYMEAK
ncbi:hypothetical protein ASPWEDRAFT_47580 [Aspergillus wentii DTO 134E9]|uniref:GST N-terminal domain-containing protein n=1 Tax=Aspergillus wentii DTO 134E9 TaxID=1073089 RepID=A0A1L9S114_ASPWE|nr:uncharacterized protein ASPWEDRAFT_47580 [Aspergillus wentii DTO 134E9]KAI9931141.1 hypothetical protein MW887_010798 [Aspergillus wentii]OJJ40856.1 hypothetical protein ASPWEDRAFT_47580 [Aspergillus wentii DTO 134E9]